MKSWRDDGVLKDVSITDSKCWLCCETPRLALPVFFHTPSHLTVFCCLSFVLRVCGIYILSYYHNSPFTFILYLHEFSTYRSIPVPPPCLSLSEYFILIYSWVGWISLSSNSLKKGSWVLYSLWVFFFFPHTISFMFSFFFIRTTWLDIILPPSFLLLKMFFFYNVFWRWVFLRRTLRSMDFFSPSCR